MTGPIPTEREKAALRMLGIDYDSALTDLAYKVVVILLELRQREEEDR